MTPRNPTVSESLRAAVESGRLRVRKPHASGPFADIFERIHPTTRIDLRPSVKSSLIPRIR